MLMTAACGDPVFHAPMKLRPPAFSDAFARGGLASPRTTPGNQGLG
jgi:hypothetical protein